MHQKLHNLLNETIDHSPKYHVDVMGKKIGIPVKYDDASALLVLFPISYQKAKALLGSDRLTPVRISKERCLLGITFFDYRDCEADPYHEFTFSIPVQVDVRYPVPLLPLIFDTAFKKYGHYVIQMGADTERARKHIELIFPYPTIPKDVPISLEEVGNELHASISDDGEEIVSVSLPLPKKFHLERKKVNTYFTHEGALNRVILNTFSFNKMILGAGDVKLHLGNHAVSQMLKNLNIESKPFATIYYKNAIEVATAAEKI